MKTESRSRGAATAGTSKPAASAEPDETEPKAEWESEGGSPPDSISQVDKDGEPPAPGRPS